ncbi:hypothetical protein TcWFU_003729 [Taenia crassiceps]|uniref:Uncharacterized protein n=1 Tax=Taenia crassiceps TaxID=6207 RepID=A0ABR4Q744_9CEST
MNQPTGLDEWISLNLALVEATIEEFLTVSSPLDALQPPDSITQVLNSNDLTETVSSSQSARQKSMKSYTIHQMNWPEKVE